MEDIPDYAFDHDFKGTTQEAEILWQDVLRIFLEAHECQEHNQDERIHGLLKSYRGSHPGQHYRLASQAIDPIYLPTSNHLTVTKKADLTLAYSMREPEIRRISKALDTAGRFLSPMTGTLTKRLAMACGVEVKQADGKSMEPKAQLAKWFTAVFSHTRSLLFPGRLKQSQDTLVPRHGTREAQVGAGTVAVLSDDATELVALLPPPLLGWTVVSHE